jgi:hypothetical protein
VGIGAISERYDIGLMSTKGLSVEAARRLVDDLCGRGVKVLVLHDFDVTGFKIFGTLGTDSRVCTFKNQVALIDIGLRLADARPLGLKSEPFEIKGEWYKHALTLQRHGATDGEIEFLRGNGEEGQRIELNMMTAPVFVSFLEAKFAKHGIKKVVPKTEILEEHARRIIKRDLAQR